MKNTLASIAALTATVMLAIAAIAFTIRDPNPQDPMLTHPIEHPLSGLEAVLYKSPTCGCCSGYAQALEAAGVSLTIINDAAATQEAKRQHNIPQHAHSCHTFTLGEYVIEGHVPLEALEHLITQRPDIDGIVLPGMPIGTPGMPGVKTAPYQVLSLQDGRLAPYLSL